VIEDVSEVFIQPQLYLRDGSVITSLADAIAYLRVHEVRPGVDARDEVLHRLERAKTKDELQAAADAFLSWLEQLELIAAPQTRDLPQASGSANNGGNGSTGEASRGLAAAAGEKISSVVADQKNAASDYVGRVAKAVRRASDQFDNEMPTAGHYIRNAAGQMEKVAGALRGRDMSGLLNDAESFARRQPVTVFGAAVLSGFAAVRFLKIASGRSA
jgi:hypothetical protein